jgi:23S rRNA (cytosine1962-C5)-methyltransferase
MENNSIIHNRLVKNLKKLKSWLTQEKIEAFRLYEKDIPEFPYIVDMYLDYALIYEKGKKLEDEETTLRDQHLNELIAALKDGLGIAEEKIVLKSRHIQKGTKQYNKLDQKNEYIVVQENQAKFYINLFDYLDTGLFLDHRPLRKILFKSCRDKKVLNLFAYTGSISVQAALGGATVTTVDMSNTYINWAYDNFRLNNLRTDDHKFVTDNVFDFLRADQEMYDVIVLDPPSFSNSKSMEGSFDVQRDHAGLVHLCMNRLAPNGILYFSNNFRKFKLDEQILKSYKVKDISEKTIPLDFRDQKIHVCFEISFQK